MLSAINKMANSSFKDILTNLKFCSYCVSRFSTTSEDKDEEIESKERECGSCLGLMSNGCLQETFSKICEIFAQKKYESEDYCLAIKLPQSLSLRQRSMGAFASQKDESLKYNIKHRTSIKEEFRQSVISKLDKEINKRHDPKSELLVNVVFKYHDDEKEIEKLESILPKQDNKSRKRQYMERQRKLNTSKSQPAHSIQVIENVLEKLNDTDVNKYITCPPMHIKDVCRIEVNICQGSIFFGGRYKKFSRTLSQTPWVIDGVRKTETSVQELICGQLLEFTSGSDVKFVSAGREDVDVRMLGEGRPFAVEIVDPRIIHVSKDVVSQLENDINQSTDQIALQDLQIITRNDLSILKQGEEEKVKHYRAKLWCPHEISEELILKFNRIKDLLIYQKTPIRVMHRRPCLKRERTIHKINIEKLDDLHYTMDIATQAGTYIKEFVHSDFGRTSPSMQSLLQADIDIIELDVRVRTIPPLQTPGTISNEKRLQQF